MRVNLVQRETGVFSLNWIRVGVTILVVVLIAGIAMNYYLLTTRQEILTQEIKSLDQQLRVLNPKKEEYLNLRTQVSQLEQEIERVEGRYIWAYITQETGFVIPGNVELNSFSISGTNLSVQGKANNTELLIDYIDNMNESPFFDNITLQNYVNQEDITFNIDADIIRREEE
jgi:Tfp pilus assembly protein PilN